jgi:hypothetical protein
MASKRFSGVEILRLFAMFCIILFHIIGHGSSIMIKGIDAFGPASTKYFKFGIYSLIIFPVDTFIFITGYFGITFNIKKITNLWLNCLVISLLVSGIFLLNKNISYISSASVKSDLKAFFPITTSLWWFFTDYFILYCISPFINISEEKYIQNDFVVIILLLLLNLALRNHLLNFFIIYIIGRIIRRNENSINLNLLYIITLFLTILSIAISLYLLYKSNNLALIEIQNYNPIVLLQAVSLFFIFKKIPIDSKFLNVLGAGSFNIYLLSDHPRVRSFIIAKFQYEALEFNLAKLILDSLAVFTLSLCVGFGVYFLCNIITIYVSKIIFKVKA